MAKKEVKSEMGNFIPESVAAAVVPIIKNNAPFIVTEQNKKYYIGMLLDVMKIGGIDKKSINDKDKGGIIEAIKSGRLDAFISQKLNDENKLLFIPTFRTIDCLGDYGVFRRVDGYEFVKLNDKLEIVENTGVMGTYDEFRAIVAGQVDIKSFVKPTDVIVAGSADDPTVSHNLVSSITDKAKELAAQAAAAVAPMVDKVKDKIADSTGVKDMMAHETKEQTQPAQSSQAQPNQAPQQTVEQTSQAEPEVEQEIIYTETQVMDSIERVFHADNLDLPLSFDPFDQLFTINNHMIKFDTDQRDGYVNAELNRMAADANRDLTKLRADNIRKLRHKYSMLMSIRIEDIQRELDIEDQTKRYGSFKAGLEGSKAQRIGSIGSTIEQRQKMISDAFETRLQEVCDNAARQAKADFKARYQRQFNDDMNAVEGVIRAEIAADHTAAMNDLYTARRSDALTTLDLNITGVLNELTQDYQNMFEDENALYISKADAMREYSKQLHLDDAKRLAVEEEHLRITNEVNDARAEAAAKIALIQREFETAQAALEARAQATIAQAENTTQLVREQMKERTDTLENDKTTLQQRLDAALERADNAQEIVKADYEHRLQQSADDRDSWKQTLDSYKAQHKHNNRLTAILVAAIAIAMLAGGFVSGGVYWNRLVANDTSAVQDDVEIKVINPNESVTTAPVDEAVESETAVTTVPEKEAIVTSSAKSAETTAVTTVKQTVETTTIATTKPVVTTTTHN